MLVIVVSCRTDKRTTGEISSIRANEGKLKSHFLDRRLILAIQLNKDNRLSSWYINEMKAFYFFVQARSLL